jgi:hypothetical protein
MWLRTFLEEVKMQRLVAKSRNSSVCLAGSEQGQDPAFRMIIMLVVILLHIP